jgi:hypothetical protein
MCFIIDNNNMTWVYFNHGYTSMSGIHLYRTVHQRIKILPTSIYVDRETISYSFTYHTKPIKIFRFIVSIAISCPTRGTAPDRVGRRSLTPEKTSGHTSPDLDRVPGNTGPIAAQLLDRSGTRDCAAGRARWCAVVEPYLDHNVIMSLLSFSVQTGIIHLHQTIIN